MNETLEKIRTLTLEKIETKGLSQNRYANQAGVAPSTITALKKREWSKFSPEMIQKFAIACGYDLTEWRIAETANLKIVMAICERAQRLSISTAVTDIRGRGKTEGFEQYTNSKERVFHLKCAGHWTNKLFMEKLLQELGVEGSELSTSMKCELAIEELAKINKPLLIIDEADKLRDSSLLFFIELYNRLDGYCGIIIAGQPALFHRIDKGCKRNKKGMNEIHSRVGRRYVHLKSISLPDVKAICQINGIFEDAHINQIFNDCEDDFRRVKRAVQTLISKLQKSSA